jgi:hypothetical protein
MTDDVTESMTSPNSICWAEEFEKVLPKTDILDDGNGQGKHWRSLFG